MIAVAVGGTIALATALCALARAANRARARDAAGGHAAHAMGANGIVVGADALQLDAGGDRGLLLLHGFNDTPQSVSQLARALWARGWTVHAPLLPQHGRGGEELASQGNAEAWIEAARREWLALRNRVARPVLCGQSMGGAIAVILSAESPPDALVLLAPYLSMGRLTRALAYAWPLWQLATPKLFTDSRRGLHDPVARASALGNWWFTPRLVRELMRVVLASRRVLRVVCIRTLVLHARSDYRIPSPSATQAFDLLGAPDKTLVWVERGGHVLAADVDREVVIETVGNWLDTKVPPR